MSATSPSNEESLKISASSGTGLLCISARWVEALHDAHADSASDAGIVTLDAHSHPRHRSPKDFPPRSDGEVEEDKRPDSVRLSEFPHDGQARHREHL